MLGKIIKLIGGNYTVLGEDLKKYVLKPLGIFRYKDLSPKVGDNVEFEPNVITKISSRKNDLTRPQIANVDQAILINAANRPLFSFDLLDRFLVLILKENIKPIIIVTKIDLLEEAELNDLKEKLSYYEKYFKVFFYSKITLENLDIIKDELRGKVSVLAGQTGAGKSSLLNALNPELSLATDDISKALGRGKHTTRHVELIEYERGLIADTPGFSKLEFNDLEKEDLKNYYPDFISLAEKCKYLGCNHVNEPKCEIKKELENGNILKSRYNNYLKIYQELKDKKVIYGGKLWK